MAQQTVLLVDDEEDILESVGDLLEGMLPVDVVKAGSGPAALVILAERPISLILTDFRMPVMDGCALLKRAQELYPATPRMMMTAFSNVLKEKQCIGIGVREVMVKPIDPERLVASVRTALAAP